MQKQSCTLNKNTIEEAVGILMKDVKTRWSVYDDGLKIWDNGQLIAKIHPSEFKYLLADLAAWLKYNEICKGDEANL